MPIKNILVHVDSTERSAATVKAAAFLADKFDARLNGFFVLPDVSATVAAPGGVAMSTAVVGDLQKEAEKHAAEAERVFRDSVGEQARPGRWICADGLGVGGRSAAASAAFYADLIVTQQPDRDDEERKGSSGSMPQDLVMDCGRPVLLLPPNPPARLATDNIVVAWSECREASRAVFDSLPFLKVARKVDVVSVAQGEAETSAPAERIAATLADHGVRAVVEMVPADGGPSTSDALFDYAQKTGADMLVAGAYSHSRLREGLIGGVTNSIFSAAPLPALLSH